MTAQADQSGRAHPQRRVGELAGPGALLLAVGRLCVPVMPAPLLPGGPAVVFAGLFVLGLGTPTPRVMIDILVFRRVADELCGRAIAATMTLFTVGMPAGTLGSGLLLDHLSPTAALAAIAGLLAVAPPPATVGRTLRRSTWPEAARPDTAGQPPDRPRDALRPPREPNLRHALLTVDHPCGCTPHATPPATG
ncbi:hypothetical protein [Kitasatospora sp. NPDC058218]|uniref:hypothetical protein n=1 Tax=Kitasatospora sp. NPDC058218 TaxID=3346385 RepID=UPI0036DEE9F5